MENGHLDRVKQDLDTMRRAIDAPPPFTMEHIWQNLLLAGVGAVVASITLWTGIASPTEDGANLWYVALMLAAALLVLLTPFFAAMPQGVSSHSSMSYGVRTVLAAILATAVYSCFAAWAHHRGFSLAALAVAAVFFVGVLQLASALGEGWHPSKCAWGLTFTCLAFLLPFASYESAGVFGGVAIMVGGLLTAGLIWLQLRGVEHAAD